MHTLRPNCSARTTTTVFRYRAPLFRRAGQHPTRCGNGIDSLYFKDDDGRLIGTITLLWGEGSDNIGEIDILGSRVEGGNGDGYISLSRVVSSVVDAGAGDNVVWTDLGRKPDRHPGQRRGRTRHRLTLLGRGQPGHRSRRQFYQRHGRCRPWWRLGQLPRGLPDRMGPCQEPCGQPLSSNGAIRHRQPAGRSIVTVPAPAYDLTTLVAFQNAEASRFYRYRTRLCRLPPQPGRLRSPAAVLHRLHRARHGQNRGEQLADELDHLARLVSLCVAEVQHVLVLNCKLLR